MIDPLSLFLGILSGYFLVSYLNEKGKWVNALLFLVMAVMTGLCKSTMFIGVLAPLSALLLVEEILHTGSIKNIFNFSYPSVKRVYISAFLFITSFIVMYTWVKYSDGIKMQNPFADKWTSANTVDWNFGTLQQRLSFSNWKQYLTYSMFAHPVSYLLIIAGIISFLFFAEKKEKMILLVLFILFISPLIFFFNLFFVHTYYSTANMIFFCMILGLIIYVLMKQDQQVIKLGGAVLGILLLSFGLYRDYVFKNQILKNEPEPGVFGKLQEINFNPGPNDILVIVDNSRDPYLQYYFKCRGININRGEYEQFGKEDKLYKLSGTSTIRMICIVSKEQLEVLPDEFTGILKGEITHKSMINEAGSNYYHNFFWY